MTTNCKSALYSLRCEHGGHPASVQLPRQLLVGDFQRFATEWWGMRSRTVLYFKKSNWQLWRKWNNTN